MNYLESRSSSRESVSAFQVAVVLYCILSTILMLLIVSNMHSNCNNTISNVVYITPSPTSKPTDIPKKPKIETRKVVDRSSYNRITSDDILYDVRSNMNINTSRFRTALRYDLKPLAQVFIDAGKAYGINPIFLSAIASEESGYGRYCFKPNNIMGYGSMSFDSKSDCIYYVAMKLKENYLDRDGVYYNGHSLYKISLYWNNTNSWRSNVTWMVNDIYRRLPP